jgi:hypothetical protein
LIGCWPACWGAVDDVPQDHPVVVGGGRLARREDAVELGAVERHADVVVGPRAQPLGVLVEDDRLAAAQPVQGDEVVDDVSGVPGLASDRFDH